MLRYFLKFEKYIPSKLFPGVDTTQRGAKGLVEGEFFYRYVRDVKDNMACMTFFCAVGFFGNFSPITRRFLDACENIGLSREHDLNTPKGTLGVAK